MSADVRQLLDSLGLLSLQYRELQREERRASAAAVQGNWWRTLVTNAVLFFIGSSFGP